MYKFQQGPKTLSSQITLNGVGSRLFLWVVPFRPLSLWLWRSVWILRTLLRQLKGFGLADYSSETGVVSTRKKEEQTEDIVV